MAGRAPSRRRPPAAEDADRVHAFITLTEKRARAKAAEIDQRLAAGEDPGPLAGIPCTVKDIFCVRGTPSSAASRILANFTAPLLSHDPWPAWRRPGTVLLGKVNLDEFTYGSSNESSAFQPSTRNPWDTSRVPGRLFSAAAPPRWRRARLCSRWVPTRRAPDREPAAFCGVVGVKPTYGRVSRSTG